MWQYANSPARRHEKRIGEDDSPPTPSVPSDQKPYAHFGSPSLLAGAKDVVPTYTAHVFVVVVWDTVAVNPSAVTVMVGPTTPLVTLHAVPRLLLYFTESAKYASSAVIRLRRSDFIDARYAFSFVFANFGIAIAAKMPMITTTIRSSISVKPLRFIWTSLPRKENLTTLAKLFRTRTSTNRALDGVMKRKQNRANTLSVSQGFSHPLQTGRKVRLFANSPRQTQESSKSLLIPEIPGSLACETLARRVSDCRGLRPVAARQFEYKRGAQRHALPPARTSPSLHQRDRRGRVTDSDQED